MSSIHRDDKPHLWGTEPENFGRKYAVKSDHEGRCTVCHARVTIDPDKGVEYGHGSECYHRPDHFPKQGSGHIGYAEYLCRVCGRGDFGSTIELVTHIGLVHDYACWSCGREHTSAQGLRTHIDETHTHVCKDCGSDHADDQALQDHRYEDHIDGGDQCPVCERWFSTTHGLRSHVGHAHSHACRECGAEHDSDDELQKHKAVDHGDDPQQCPVCEAWFPTAKSEENHIRKTHSHACRECGAEHKSENDRRRHRLVVHDGSEADELFDCPTCGKPFSDRPSMRKHHTRAHDERLVTMVECGNPACDVEFEKNKNRSTYCSVDCADAAKVVDRMEKECAVCGDPFEVRPSIAEKFATCGDDECATEHRRSQFEETCVECGADFRNSIETKGVERCWDCRDKSDIPETNRSGKRKEGVAGD